MAQAQKKMFATDPAQDASSAAKPLDAFAQTPFAFWSQIADMQRQMLASMTQGAVEKAESVAAANVAELRPTAAAPAAIGRNWMDAATECQRELASFLAARMTKNQAFITSLMAAPGPSEWMQLHAGWLNETATDYTNELGKLGDIVKNGADEALAATA